MSRGTRVEAEQLARCKWAHPATCAGVRRFCEQPYGTILATCGECLAVSECARQGQAELLNALASADPGDGRIYAGHQMAELVAIGHTSKSQALAMLDIAGGLTKERSTA